VNISDLLGGGGSYRGKMQELADIIAAEWAAEARGQLRRSAGTYLKSIGIREVTDTKAVVALPGPGVDKKTAQLARIVEFGMGPGGIGTQGSYDVRKFLLRASTRNIKWGKNGPYLNVPFTRRGAASPTPGPLEIERLGGRRALAAARKLGANVGQRSASGKWNTLQIGGRLGSGWAAKMRSHHVSDPLAGLVRTASTYADGKWQTSGFKVWRRASWANRDPAAWRSKGVRAHRIAQRVAAKLPDLIAEVF
jgi:hypothetical protein